MWFSQRDGDIYVSDLDDVLNGVVKIGDVLMSINGRPITNVNDLDWVEVPFVMQLHPIDDQCSSYIKCTRLNDLEAYSIVNQRLVQVNERLRQQRIDEELVCQQQQPIDREIEAQNGKRKRKAAIYSQSDKKYLESQQPKRKKQKLDNKEVSIEVDAQDLFSYELFDKKMRNEVNQNGDDDHDNEEPCNNINNRSMDYKDNEYRRRIGIFRARSGPTRGQLEREKVVPFLLPNNHIQLDDQDNAQVVVPTKLNLTKRVRFSCSYERLSLIHI